MVLRFKAGFARCACAAATVLALSGCLGGTVPTGQTSVTAPGAQVTGAAADKIDAIFAQAGCRMSTTDVAAAFGGSQRELDAALEKMLFSGEMTLTMATPAAIITSHRGPCR